MLAIRRHTEEHPAQPDEVSQDISHGERAFESMVEMFLLTQDPDLAHAAFINQLKTDA